MNKRDFLKIFSLSAMGLSLDCQAQVDYSKKDIHSEKYQYNPQHQSPLNMAEEEARKIEENDVSMNSQYKEIIPKNENDFWNKPRIISLHRVETRERKVLTYFSNQKINKEDYWLSSYLLRDVKYNTMAYMDLKLLDLICAIQAWIKYYNINPEFQILSGLRTVEHNRSLLSPGKRNESSALNSMHIYGKAIDFYIPNLSVKQIAKIADIFQAGGIGLYPQRNFIHLDTGRIRKWTK